MVTPLCNDAGPELSPGSLEFVHTDLSAQGDEVGRQDQVDVAVAAIRRHVYAVEEVGRLAAVVGEGKAVHDLMAQSLNGKRCPTPDLEVVGIGKVGRGKRIGQNSPQVE